MSLDFIKSGLNSDHIERAQRQQKEISYFAESDISTTQFSQEYLDEWVNRNYQSGDSFSNWMKSILKTDNFLQFIKYKTNPLPSSNLIQSSIDPHLEKVLYAEDSVFEHEVKNGNTDDIEELLDHKWINEELFYHTIYRPNDLLVDLPGTESPDRFFVEIDQVKAIEENRKGIITKVAYATTLEYFDEEQEANESNHGIMYIDSNVYTFYIGSDHDVAFTYPHGLGRCPVQYVGKKRFKNEKVVKKSIFSYPLDDLRSYVILNILRKISDINGVFPVATILDVDSEDEEDEDRAHGVPGNADMMRSQSASVSSDNTKTGRGTLQAGSVHYAPMVDKEDGSIDTTLVENFVKFHYVPKDILDHIDTRIEKLKQGIIKSILGGEMTEDNQAMNVDQVGKNVSGLDNVLISIGNQMSVTRKISDENILSLSNPDKPNRVVIHYGTDFYLDSVDKLIESFDNAPNPIERKSILLRINQNKFKNNPSQKSRQKILYELMPYASDKDFEIALNNNIVSDSDKLMQLKFHAYIGKFELNYGDIVSFYNGSNASDFEKIQEIKNLLNLQIKPDLQSIKQNLDNS